MRTRDVRYLELPGRRPNCSSDSGAFPAFHKLSQEKTQIRKNSKEKLHAFLYIFSFFHLHIFFTSYFLIYFHIFSPSPSTDFASLVHSSTFSRTIKYLDLHDVRLRIPFAFAGSPSSSLNWLVQSNKRVRIAN